MTVSKAQQKAVSKYTKENYDEIKVRVEKGQKDVIKAAGKTLILQAVPPFEYGKEKLPLWERVNNYVKETLAPKADLFFDPAPVLTADGKTPLYGGHPNETGCALWAEALYQAMRHLF